MSTEEAPKRAMFLEHLLNQEASKRSRFLGRGLDDRVITALIAAGFEYPEQVLLMPASALARHPNVGAAALRQIEAYRTHISSRQPD